LREIFFITNKSVVYFLVFLSLSRLYKLVKRAKFIFLAKGARAEKLYSREWGGGRMGTGFWKVSGVLEGTPFKWKYPERSR